MLIIKTLLLLAAATCALTTPVPKKEVVENGKILYDQRQEGEWNVRADLKNFVILIIPTPSSSASTPAAAGGLLDFLTKSMPSRTHLKRLKHKKPSHEAAQETMHFIESKTAPYHVDLTRTESQIHPVALKNEEVVISNNTPKSGETPVLMKPLRVGRSRISRAFVLTVPPNEEFVLTKTEDHKKVVKKDVKKKTIKEMPKHTLKLLGAENEQCGPGLERDSYGNCRPNEK